MLCSLIQTYCVHYAHEHTRYCQHNARLITHAMQIGAAYMHENARATTDARRRGPRSVEEAKEEATDPLPLVPAIWMQP